MPDHSSDLGKRRITLLTIIVVIIGSYVVINLFQKSVLGHRAAVARAEKQYITKKEIPSSRGKIYAQDRMGGEITSLTDGLFPLATNTYNYDVNVIPNQIKKPGEVAEQLAKLLDLDVNDLKEKLSSGKLYLPPIKKKIDEEIAQKIKDLNFKGVFLTVNEQRIYPETNLAAQVLGFVNGEGKGNYGLENYYDEVLRGKEGAVLAKKDNLGRLINIDAEYQPQDGGDLVLSLDHNIQFIADQKLQEGLEKYQADSGTIIVQEVKTGRIIALTSKPDYDPNLFNEVKPEDQKLFLNPAISLVWEPGSIIKPLVMAAALDMKLVEPDTEEVFSNMVKVSNYEIHTAQDKAFGRETMTQVLENSDNVAMVWLAEKMGSESLYKYFSSFGFMKKTGIDLDGETIGSILELKKWHDIERSTMSFGQGMSMTPLQLVSAYSALANKGVMMKPYIVDKIIESGKERKTEPKEVERVISEEAAKKIADMLVSVVVNGHGKKAGVKGYKVAGKTGTAQIPDDKGGYYEDRHVGSFAGYFPADDPQYAMLVKLDNPKNVEWAEASAAPVFGELAEWIINYYSIPPTEPTN